MRMWTKSACVVLAWSIVIILVAVGMKESVRPVQTNIRIASSTTEITLASTCGVAAASGTAPRPAPRYVVRPGDTLSGIAARFAVPGGWSALYAANRSAIGPDPNLIHAGTVLVLAGHTARARYTVAAGDTLSGIAAALAVPGGWPALYAANRPAIGPDPGLIRPGTVLTITRPAAPAPAASPARPSPAPPSAPAGRQAHPRPATTPHPQPVRTPHSRAARTPHPRPAARGAPAAAGMPPWLKTMLLALGLLIGAGLLAEPVLLLIRRRRRRAATEAVALPEHVQEPAPVPRQRNGHGPGSGRPAAGKARIVLADHDRLIVTHSKGDNTVYVLRPHGEDPRAILRVARLALPESPYRELAKRLGMPASWPIVLVDYDRVVVTHNKGDGMVYVLRPPGEDPKAILRAARLVLPEEPYEELADQLGVPAGLPME